MAEPFGLFIQLLPTQAEQVLAVGHVVGLRNGDRSFSPADLVAFFGALRVPAPVKPANVLARLRSDGLVVSSGRGRWSLTPQGEREAADLVDHIDLSELEVQLADLSGAEFGHVVHRVIAPEFAPPRWGPPLARLLERFPFEGNVFCMTRFPDDPPASGDPVPAVIGAVRDTLEAYGLRLLLASERAADDELWGNVGAHMWASQYGIGLLEDRVGKGLNQNVVIELGSMVITGRRCAMLKDTTAPDLPTDLSGQIYKPVDFDDLDSVVTATKSW